MVAEYMHIGIPVLNKKEGMTYSADMKFWVNNVDDYDSKIEHPKLEGGTLFPGISSKQPHVAYKVNDLELHAEQAQQVIFGPMDCGSGVRLVFVIWDDAIVELYEEKQEEEAQWKQT